MDIEDLAELSVAAARVGTLSELFDSDPDRSDWLTVEVAGVHADFSRQRIDRDLFEAVLGFAERNRVDSRFSAMVAGEPVNGTEGRAALHTACRARGGESPEAAGARAELERAMRLADGVRSGAVTSSAGRRFEAVVNIGIGGSDLGPATVTRALRRFSSGPLVRFVSNIDGADMDAALEGLDPASTLFVVASKTFTTLETMHNAERAREWSTGSGGEWSANFVAATTNVAAAVEWGIRPDHCLRFFEWVGGRYSVSSVVGFPVMCAIGGGGFLGFLDGMADMDEHAARADLGANLPFLHAMVWFVNSALHGHQSVCVAPYSSDLARLPAYLQQLVMESNGKSVRADGSTVAWDTCPVVWGEPGTNGQHAFFQMLHQGTRVVPVEFIGSVVPSGSDARAHELLLANMFAQSEALATGRDATQVRAAGEREDLVVHKVFPGNRPSSVLLLADLTPRALGALLAMYEHSTVFQGLLAGVNSFDQWGVELGKTVASSIARHLVDGDDPPTNGWPMVAPLIEWYRQQRG